MSRRPSGRQRSAPAAASMDSATPPAAHPRPSPVHWCPQHSSESRETIGNAAGPDAESSHSPNHRAE
ncbi:MAG TPA: hypothetical protein DC058_03670 [Planctomycetaceae bacterium]|nr:hypothetical protein [Planctomycetaceae bacterium]HBC60301.1 hypothetical protein [Planctomycetaceae bacterium]